MVASLAANVPFVGRQEVYDQSLAPGEGRPPPSPTHETRDDIFHL